MNTLKIELSFNQFDPVQKEAYKYLSNTDYVRRSILIADLIKEYLGKEEKQLTPLEQKLLDIIESNIVKEKEFKGDINRPLRALTSQVNDKVKLNISPKEEENPDEVINSLVDEAF